MLTHFSAGPDALEYRVVSSGCINGKCPVLVELVRDGKELDSRELEVAGTSSSFEPAEAGFQDGVGDPAWPEKNVAFWVSGDPEEEMGLAVRPVKLSAGQIGILIDQRAGFEHLKRFHALLAVKDDKLMEVWKAADGAAGPTFTSTALVETQQRTQMLVFYSGLFYPQDQSDTLAVQGVGWDLSKGKMTSRTVALEIMTLGSYAAPQEAQRARRKYRACGVELWVLPSHGLDAASKGKFVLATFATTAVHAEAANASLKRCATHAVIDRKRIVREAFQF